MIKKAIDLLNKKVAQLSEYFGIVSGVIIAIAVFFVTADVILRYAFNRPIAGGYEYIAFAMIPIVFISLAYTAVKGSHVSLSFIFNKLPEKVQAIINPCITLFGLCLFGAISYMCVVQGLRWLDTNQTSQILQLPFAAFAFVIAFGGALFCLVMILKFYNEVSIAGNDWKFWAWLIFGVILVLVFYTFPLWFLVKISSTTAAIVALITLLVLAFLKVPIAFAMGAIGFIGVSYLTNIGSGLTFLATRTFTVVYSYDLCVIPLFVLMGMYALYSGLSRNLYDSAYHWLGHQPGGLAMASIGACAAFSAICGSTIATAGAMGAVSLPEMKRFNYSPALATGCLAAGGSLGILIPPSTILIIYGLVAQQSIGRLFVAGFLPGILLAILFIITIYIICRINPNLGPRGIKSSAKEKIGALGGLLPVIVLFLIVIGGIYRGIFSPTEGAAIGAFGAFIIMLARRTLTLRNFLLSITDTVQTTGMTMIIVVGGTMLGSFIAMTGIPVTIVDIVEQLEVSRYLIFASIMLIYLAAGCLMDSLTLLILLVPLVLPLIVAIGFDPIWFGIIAVLQTEMGAVTPPMGINVFVISGVAKDIPLEVIFRGMVPFLIAMIICLIILTAFPSIVTFLPNLLY